MDSLVRSKRVTPSNVVSCSHHSPHAVVVEDVLDVLDVLLDVLDVLDVLLDVDEVELVDDVVEVVGNPGCALTLQYSHTCLIHQRISSCMPGLFANASRLLTSSRVAIVYSPHAVVVDDVEDVEDVDDVVEDVEDVDEVVDVVGKPGCVARWQ